MDGGSGYNRLMAKFALAALAIGTLACTGASARTASKPAPAFELPDLSGLPKLLGC